MGDELMLGLLVAVLIGAVAALTLALISKADKLDALKEKYGRLEERNIAQGMRLSVLKDNNAFLHAQLDQVRDLTNGVAKHNRAKYIQRLREICK